MERRNDYEREGKRDAEDELAEYQKNGLFGDAVIPSPARQVIVPPIFGNTQGKQAAFGEAQIIRKRGHKNKMQGQQSGL